MPTVSTHLLRQFRLVLVRPKDPKNLGAAARAMTNMGFSRLTLVSPECSINNEAHAVAVGCSDVLDSVRITMSISEAVKGAGLVAGFTRRVGKHRPASRALRECATRWVQLAEKNEIVLVFGPEDYGLSGEDLVFCQELVRIPTAERFPSINLAQAVLLVCYEVFLAAAGAPPSPTARQLASAEEREALVKSMFEALRWLEYFGGRDPAHSMRYFRQTFDRAGLSPDDVRLWRGVFERVVKRTK